MQMKKQWIAFHSQVGGVIEIDDGAEKAIFTKEKVYCLLGSRMSLVILMPWMLSWFETKKGKLSEKDKSIILLRI